MLIYRFVVYAVRFFLEKTLGCPKDICSFEQIKLFRSGMHFVFCFSWINLTPICGSMLRPIMLALWSSTMINGAD